ncbi:ATP-dependent helicase DinG [Parageobacillus thermoglucosidasius]|uniref:ATP-dependent DNA helicase DinG n=1 Tax=Parageobacillus thermoglucosidasius TaxID=1426 RepID=UPI000F621E21|nr:ATP-dependent DNA helicase DinG [Parageobacillus thermoglucosidasius]GCD82122.1 ATP-dependent helicase DinG [Parageobacillus thermoglucosidasius]
MKDRFVIMDLETTGNVPKKGDRIIQLGMVVVENGQIIERFSSFFNPERDIPPFVQQLTNINEQMVADAPVFAEEAAKVVDMLQQSYFVAHNVSFDLQFLQEELHMAGFPPFSGPTIDTVELARIVFPDAESYKLADLAKLLCIAHDQPHHADSDAEVTAKLFIALLDRLRQLPLVTLQHLKRLSAYLKSDLYSLLDNMIMEKMTSLADEKSYIFYHGVALKKPAPVQKKDKGDHKRVTFAEFFAGPRVLPLAHYERRDGQWEMMKLVYEALETSQHALVEAGTGIGKSLAYLIPSAFFAHERQKRVVISTHTLQLQQQLLERDIPFVKTIVPFPLRVAVLKGKRNYLSLDKFVAFLREHHHNYDVVLLKCQLLVWLTKTETGDMDELNVSSGARLFLPLLFMDEEDNGSKHNFFLRAKQRAEEADIVITNHAFLLHDVTASTPLLPDYEHIVIDEAHHLEDVASHYFGQQVDYVSIRLLLTRIGKINENGSLAKLMKLFERHHLSAEERFLRCERLVEELQFECDELFRMMRRYALDRKPPESGRCRYRIEPKTESGRQWSAMKELLWRVRDHVAQLVDETKRLRAVFIQNEMETSRSNKSCSYFSDVFALNQIVDALFDLMESDDPMIVRWIEAEEKGAANATAIYSQPIQLDEFFAERLFMRKKSVVLTSATLTMNGSFSYIISRLGLSDFYPVCQTIPSPFSFKDQAILMVPSDFPSISSVSLEEYASAVADGVTQIAERIKGKMLVLFTSYELLRLTAAAMNMDERSGEHVLIAQGIQSGSAAKLTRVFQQFEQAILFGTSNFWEGVDLPGDELSVVVIVRLPFAPPDDPVISAKSEHIRAKGGNPFYELSLPEAVLRFKQGFGRLIRTKKDRGAVFVLDRRLTSASYGKYFLNSLPPLHVYEQSLDQLLQKLENWL